MCRLASMRERFESLNAATFGVGGIPVQNYVLDREYIHADIRPNQNWQIFIQLQNDYAPGKSIITPVDRDPLDLGGHDLEDAARRGAVRPPLGDRELQARGARGDRPGVRSRP